MTQSGIDPATFRLVAQCQELTNTSQTQSEAPSRRYKTVSKD